jgi:predicted nucleic acid-binding protein
MPYADTDYVLALAKPSDWLKKRAERLRAEYGDRIYTSTATLMELLIYAKRHDIDPEALIASGCALFSEIRPLTMEHALQAAHHVKEDGLDPLDALHAACAEDEIISSDRAYERAGLRVISLSKP